MVLFDSLVQPTVTPEGCQDCAQWQRNGAIRVPLWPGPVLPTSHLYACTAHRCHLCGDPLLVRHIRPGGYVEQYVGRLTLGTGLEFCEFCDELVLGTAFHDHVGELLRVAHDEHEQVPTRNAAVLWLMQIRWFCERVALRRGDADLLRTARQLAVDTYIQRGRV